MEDANPATALWGAVVASGIYHGVNPGMGWPLAVSAALMERGTGALYKALLALAAGHLLAMAVVLFPFSLMVTLVEWQYQLRVGAALLVIWIFIVVSHLRLRKQLEASGKLTVRMWLFPYLSYATLAMLGVFVVLMLFLFNTIQEFKGVGDVILLGPSLNYSFQFILDFV